MIEVFELQDKSNAPLHPNVVDEEISPATLASVKAARIHDYRGHFTTSNSLIKIERKLPSGTSLDFSSGYATDHEVNTLYARKLSPTISNPTLTGA
eukprot:1836497-Pleurochrysis_carterae.AAC.1